MKFPSKEFYNDSLRIASENQRKRSELTMWACSTTPIKFIDVVGYERTRSVATEVSAQQSKYNVEEVKEAVSCILCVQICILWVLSGPVINEQQLGLSLISHSVFLMTLAI